MKRLFLLAFIWAFASGCSRSLSSNIATSEIYITETVTGDGSSSVACSATFHVGGVTGTYIELNGTDKVYCSDGTTQVQLSANSSILGSISYEGGSGLAYQAGGTYSILFQRSSSESYTASGALPTAPVITSPAASANITQGSSVNVTWNNTGTQFATVSLAYTQGSSSGTSTTGPVTDDGSETLPASYTTPSGTSGNVSATISVINASPGTFPSGLKGGTFYGKQTDTVDVTLVP